MKVGDYVKHKYEPIKGKLIYIDEDDHFCKVELDGDYIWQPKKTIELFYLNIELDHQKIREEKINKILNTEKRA